MYHGVVAANQLGNFALTAEKDLEEKGTTGNFIAFDLFIKLDFRESGTKQICFHRQTFYG